MYLVGSTNGTSMTLFRSGLQKKLMIGVFKASNRNATVYATGPGRELSKAQLDVVNKVTGGPDERGYHIRRAMEHIKEAERLDEEGRAKKD